MLPVRGLRAPVLLLIVLGISFVSAQPPPIASGEELRLTIRAQHRLPFMGSSFLGPGAVGGSLHVVARGDVSGHAAQVTIDPRWVRATIAILPAHLRHRLAGAWAPAEHFR